MAFVGFRLELRKGPIQKVSKKRKILTPHFSGK